MKRCVIDNVIYMFEMKLNLIKCFYYISFYFYHNANAYEFHAREYKLAAFEPQIIRSQRYMYILCKLFETKSNDNDEDAFWLD